MVSVIPRSLTRMPLVAQEPAGSLGYARSWTNRLAQRQWKNGGRYRILDVDSMLALCEHGVVNVISSTTIKRYAALHTDAADELLRWNKAASHAVWRDVNEVRLHFPDADQYKSLLVFNIRHNYYRLIVKVDYRAKLLMVKEFLTHKEYTRGGWKKWAR
jgi:mRNA interferase HigB